MVCDAPSLSVLSFAVPHPTYLHSQQLCMSLYDALTCDDDGDHVDAARSTNCDDD